MSTIFNLRPKWQVITAFIILATTLTISGYHGLADNFFELDDIRFIHDAQQTWENPSYFFSFNKSLPGRPTTEAVFALLYPITKHNPSYYHQVLILLHILAGLLLAFTLYRLGHDLELCFVSTIVFLLNAAPVRAVQWISCLAYPLALIFSLTTILAFHFYIKSANKIHIVAAAILLTLAGLSHPAALATSGCCIYMAYIKYGYKPILWQTIWPLLAITIALPLFLTLSFPHMPQAYVVTTHLQTDLWHFGLKFFLFVGSLFTRMFYLPVDMGWRTIDILLGAGICIFFTISIYKKHPLALWILFACLSLIPFLNVLDEETYSRFLYIASAGSAVLSAYILRTLILYLPRYQKIALPLLLISLSIESIHTLQRAESRSLFASGLYNFVQMTHTQNQDVRTQMEQLGYDDFTQAMNYDGRLISQIALRGLYFGQTFPTQIQLARQNQPENIEPKILDIIYDVLNGQFHNAQNDLDQLITQHPQHRSFAARAWHNIGHLYYKKERLEAAKASLLEAIKYDGQNPEILHKLGKTRAALGEFEQAKDHYQKSINIAPNYHYTYASYMDLLIRQNQFDAALMVKNSAPLSVLRYAWIHFHEGIIHARKNNRTKAIHAFESAIKYDPHHESIPQLIANIYIHWAQEAQKQTDVETAQKYFSKAQEILPKNK